MTQKKVEQKTSTIFQLVILLLRLQATLTEQKIINVMNNLGHNNTKIQNEFS